MFGQSLLSAFGIACTTDTDQLFGTDVTATSTATYQLNNATTSIPSNTYPGTANNITYTSGKFGNAAVFNGSNADIDISSSAINTTSSYTISMWLNIVDVTQYEGIFANVTSSYLTNQIAFVLNNGKINIYSVVSNGNTTLDNTTATPQSAITNNTWFNLVIVADRSLANKAKVFFNGVEASYGFVSGGAGTASYSNIKVGLADGVGRYFTGSIDQIRFFNSSLPQSAVTALYNETTTTATSASVDYVDANPNSIAYYKMSNATDQLGNYNGTATNVNFNTEGKFGFAGAFNGSSSYISLPAGINKNNNFSWSFWYMFNTYTAYDTPIGFFMNSCTNFIDTLGSGRLSFYDGNSRLTTPSSTFTAGTWYHVVVTKSSTAGRKFYVNGSVVATDSGNSNSGSSSGGRNLLGAYSSSGNPTSTAFEFDGKLDQIRIYDSAISAADVTTLYTEVECEPAAINALDQFNTVIYTGSGGTEPISTVGFKPGLTWIKNRDNAYSHQLYDIVRGTGSSKNLQSDNNKVQGNDANLYGFLSSFDTNGYTVQSGTSSGYNNIWTNQSGEDYVAWNWKAPLANLSTSFNGSSSYITISGLSSMFSTKATFTVSLWFKTTATGNRALFDDYTSNNYNIQLYLYDGILNVATRFSGGDSNMTASSTTYNDGNWHYVAVTSNQTTYNTYVDGGSPITWTASSNSHSGQTPTVTTGASQGGAVNFFNGDIAQLRIFNDTLTASEVADLYAEPAASNNTLNYPAGAGCIAAYPLQTDAVDLSGNYSGASSNVTFGQPGYLTQNTDGAITSTVAANQEAGFSVVQWTSPSGNGNPSNVGHGLSKAPELIFYKGINYADNWYVYSQPTGLNKYLNLNTNGAVVPNNSNGFTNINSSTFTTNLVNGSNNILSYCFTSIPGYSHIGSYVGTSSAGNFQYTGFEPSWLMVKCSSVGGRDWVIFDDKRISGSSYYELYPNTSGAENGPYPDVTLNSTGFTLGTNASFSNQSGDTYIFLAIA